MNRDNPRIRNLRRSKGWTQTQLAARADLSLRTIQFAESGRGTLKMQTLNQIATALECDLSDLLLDDSVYRDDALQRIPWSVSTMLRRRFIVPSEATCTRPDQVTSVLLRMRSEWKAHLHRTCTRSADELYLRADRLFDEDINRYLDRYLDLWRHDPRTIQVATDGQAKFGLSVVLPLTKDAFNSFADGTLELLDIRSKHLLQSSQYLLLDSVCEFTDSPDIAWHQLTSTLSFTMISQIARFSIDPLRDDFQMVSFAASELNAVRLRESGFRPNGSCASKIDCPIQVFSRVSHGRFTEQYVQSANMSHIARLTRESWLAGLNRRRKQATLTLLLKILKRIQNFQPTAGTSLVGESCKDPGSVAVA